MRILHRVPWTIQPQYPAGINRSHPVGKDVLAYFNAGESLRVGSNFPTTQTGVPSVGAAGKCLDYNGSQKTQYPRDAAIINGMTTATGCAALLVFDCDALTNYGGLISLQETPTTYTVLELRLGESSTDSHIVAGRANSSGYKQFVVSGINRVAAGDKGVRILVSFADDQLLTSPFIYINGIPMATAALGGAGTGQVGLPPTKGVVLGSRESGTVFLDGRIYNGWVIGRGVTAAEGIALTRTPNSPYALFANTPIDIWAPSAGDAAGVFTPYWYQQHIAAGMHGECA